MFRQSRLKKVEKQVAEMRNLLVRLDAAIVTRDPGNARSVDAYEGLRKQVASTARHRTQHVVQLAALADAIDRGATIETVKLRTEEWCDQAGLTRLEVAEPAEAFEVIEGEGPVLEVITPAWVDIEGQRVVRPGTARRVPLPPTDPAAKEDDGPSAESEQVSDSVTDDTDLAGPENEEES
jgi:hypothetical protein